MAIVLWPGVCSFDVPRGWSWETHEGVVSVFREDGSGAIQIAIVPGDAGVVLDSELERFVGAHIERSGSSARVQHEADRWLVTVVAGRGKSAAITVHLGAVDEGAKIEKLVRSFSWL